MMTVNVAYEFINLLTLFLQFQYKNMEINSKYKFLYFCNYWCLLQVLERETQKFIYLIENDLKKYERCFYEVVTEKQQFNAPTEKLPSSAPTHSGSACGQNSKFDILSLPRVGKIKSRQIRIKEMICYRQCNY